MRERILITGGAGFIGAHLAEYLLCLGYGVSALDNYAGQNSSTIPAVQEMARQGRIRLYEGDCRNTRLVNELVHEHDTVIHLAARLGVCYVMHNRLDTITNNIDATHSVLDACARFGRKVLIASSSEVYGKLDNPALTESDGSLLGPASKSRWCYAASKIIDEHLVLDYVESGLDAVIMRFFNITGAMQSEKFGMVVPRFVSSALRNEPLSIYSDGRQVRTFCDVRDCIKAVHSLMTVAHGKNRVFNIGSENEISILGLARLVIDMTGSGSRLNFISVNEMTGHFDDILHRKPDTGLIRRKTGWEPEYSLQDTINSVIKHFRNETRVSCGECVYG